MKMHHNISRLSMDKSINLNHSIKSFNDSFKQTYNQHLWIDNTKSQMNSNGKYKIIRTIGQGNFAKVKLAIHLLTGREGPSDYRDQSLAILDNMAQNWFKQHRYIPLVSTLSF
ncbi:unnamed protein product [Schistosoma curassoni]|uniref:Protein kinase domain-containing protein n=1 Tax=Schistosoma curassoni TaxID=6186 RepID=A0A183KPB4_9TREM|nr:unnamed protein product [Schistosoma curassoni]